MGGLLIHSVPEVWVALVCGVCSLASLIPFGLAVMDRTGAFSHLRDTRIMGLLFAVMGYGSSTLFSMLMTINLGNVPSHRRGTVLSVIATVFGLSAAFFTLFYNDVFQSNVANFLFFLCALLTTSCLVTGLVLRRVDPLVWSTDSLDALLLGGDNDEFPRRAPSSSINGGAVVNSDGGLPEDDSFLSMERENARFEQLTHGKSMELESDAEEQSEEAHLARLVAQDLVQHEYHLRVFGGGLLGRFFGSLWYLVQHRNFWLIAVIVFFIVGPGLMAINNAGHVVQSLNGGVQDGPLTTILILTLSLSNGSGRLLMGLSDYVACRRGVWLCIVAVLMSLTHFANAFLVTTKHDVFLTVIGVGLAYGGLWAVVPIIVSDEFGVAHFPLNVGWALAVAGPASLFFNYFAGDFYDQHTPPGSNVCAGVHCYRDSFLLCACGAAFASVLALILVPRTRLVKPKKKSSK